MILVADASAFSVFQRKEARAVGRIPLSGS